MLIITYFLINEKKRCQKSILPEKNQGQVTGWVRFPIVTVYLPT